MSKYPDLGLIEVNFCKLLERVANHSVMSGNISLHMFSQWWGNTCMGLDVCDDGSTAWGGCAMTMGYTTIAHDGVSGIYGVYFGNELGYIVKDVNERFTSDLGDLEMLSVSEAKKYYNIYREKENV